MTCSWSIETLCEKHREGDLAFQRILSTENMSALFEKLTRTKLFDRFDDSRIGVIKFDVHIILTDFLSKFEKTLEENINESHLLSVHPETICLEVKSVPFLYRFSSFLPRTRRAVNQSPSMCQRMNRDLILKSLGLLYLFSALMKIYRVIEDLPKIPDSLWLLKFQNKYLAEKHIQLCTEIDLNNVSRLGKYHQKRIFCLSYLQVCLTTKICHSHLVLWQWSKLTIAESTEKDYYHIPRMAFIPVVKSPDTSERMFFCVRPSRHLFNRSDTGLVRSFTE